MSNKAIFWAGVVIVVVLALPLLVRTNPTASNQPPAPAIAPQEASGGGETGQAASPSQVVSPAEPYLPPTMTRAQFSLLRPGMTYAQCVELAGREGSPITPVSEATEAYSWLDPDGRTEFQVLFRNGRVMGMSMNMTSAAQAQSQARLRALQAQTQLISRDEVYQLEQAARRKGQPLTIAIDEFERIQTGMTYDECVAIIGVENQMARNYAAQRNALLSGQTALGSVLDEAYPWSNPGGYYAEITFHNGRVTAKTWKKGPSSVGGASGSSRSAPLP